jgi:hypothetical protein
MIYSDVTEKYTSYVVAYLFITTSQAWKELRGFSHFRKTHHTSNFYGHLEIAIFASNIEVRTAIFVAVFVT